MNFRYLMVFGKLRLSSDIFEASLRVFEILLTSVEKMLCLILCVSRASIQFPCNTGLTSSGFCPLTTLSFTSIFADSHRTDEQITTF